MLALKWSHIQETENIKQRKKIETQTRIWPPDPSSDVSFCTDHPGHVENRISLDENQNSKKVLNLQFAYLADRQYAAQVLHSWVRPRQT